MKLSPASWTRAALVPVVLAFAAVTTTAGVAPLPTILHVVDDGASRLVRDDIYKVDGNEQQPIGYAPGTMPPASNATAAPERRLVRVDLTRLVDAESVTVELRAAPGRRFALFARTPTGAFVLLDAGRVRGHGVVSLDLTAARGLVPEIEVVALVR